MTADEILEQLMAGNQRYVAKNTTHQHHEDMARMSEVAMRQHPIAVILGCSDSRVLPEFIFDRGIGDLFVIRVAGNVLDDVVLGSIEYAVEHFGICLIIVLGHERCGAVTAAVRHLQVYGHVNAVMAAIEPAVAMVQDFDPDPIEAAVIANIKLTVKGIEASAPILAELVDRGKLKVVGARYDLDDGLVQIVL
jgi:carbonic anhydrase